MANVPDDLRYTTDHEYAKRTGEPDVFLIGITDYAQGELGDVVFLNLPRAGDRVTAHQVFGTIEAVKAVADLFAPLAGEVLEANAALDADPGAVNRDPYGAGWMIKLRAADPAVVDGLLTAEAYRAHTGA